MELSEAVDSVNLELRNLGRGLDLATTQLRFIRMAIESLKGEPESTVDNGKQ